MSLNETHHYHSFLKRGLYSLTLIVLVMTVGTVGIHKIEGFPYIDSFYFMSMIATGQGPVPTANPVTTAGKLFTALMAFISVGSMLAAFGFLFGPFLGKLWHVGKMKFEEELHMLEKLKNKK